MDLLVSAVIYTQAPPLPEPNLAFAVQTHQNQSYTPPSRGKPERKKGGGSRA